MVAVAGEALLTVLSPEACERLAVEGQRRSYDDGALIHSRGDSSINMGVVISGGVRLCQIHPDGGQTLQTIILPGQHYGDILLFTNYHRTHDALAMGPTVIDHYDAGAFDRICADPEIVKALYKITALRLGTVMMMNDDLRGLPREVHLAKLLLNQWRLNGRHPAVPCVQEDLASIMGVSNMTLSKCLAKLKAAGLIETGYRRITIKDAEALRKLIKASTTN